MPHQVDYPRKKRFENSMDKTDVSRAFLRHSKYPATVSPSYSKGGVDELELLLQAGEPEEKPLLAEKGSMDTLDEPVNEPEDNLPPPTYHSISV